MDAINNFPTGWRIGFLRRFDSARGIGAAVAVLYARSTQVGEAAPCPPGCLTKPRVCVGELPHGGRGRGDARARPADQVGDRNG